LITRVRSRSPMLIYHQGGCVYGQKARNDGISLTQKQTRACGSGHHHEKLERLLGLNWKHFVFYQ
jgi:hypothetical protein